MRSLLALGTVLALSVFASSKQVEAHGWGRGHAGHGHGWGGGSYGHGGYGWGGHGYGGGWGGRGYGWGRGYSLGVNWRGGGFYLGHPGWGGRGYGWGGYGYGYPRYSYGYGGYGYRGYGLGYRASYGYSGYYQPAYRSCWNYGGYGFGYGSYQPTNYIQYRVGSGCCVDTNVISAPYQLGGVNSTLNYSFVGQPSSVVSGDCASRVSYVARSGTSWLGNTGNVGLHVFNPYVENQPLKVVVEQPHSVVAKSNSHTPLSVSTTFKGDKIVSVSYGEKTPSVESARPKTYFASNQSVADFAKSVAK